MPDTFVIRSAEVMDAGEIARVQVESWRTTYAGIIREETLAALSVDRFRQMWETQQANPETSILVVVDGSDVVGFVSGGPTRDVEHQYSRCDAEIYAIYLLQSAQGRGMGRALMLAMARTLLERGFTGMFLWVLKANPALGFYERMGGVLASAGTVELGGQKFEELALEWEVRLLAG